MNLNINNNYILLENKVPINEFQSLRKLPDDLLNCIHSFITESDQKNCTLVSRDWRNNNLRVIKNRELSLIIKLLNSTSKELNASVDSLPGSHVVYSRFKTEIALVINSIKNNIIAEYRNFKQLNDSISASRDAVLNVFKRLNKETLIVLKKAYARRPTQRSFQHIFQLAIIYQKSDLARTQGNNNFDSDFSEISREYLKIEEFSLALQAAQTITQEEVREDAICEIFCALALNSMFDRASTVANMIPSGPLKEEALVDICTEMASTQLYYDHALIVANMSNDDALKERVLLRVSNNLAEDERYDQAIVVANMSNDDALKEQALCKVFFELGIRSMFDEASRVANMIPSGPLKKKSLVNICTEMAINRSYDHVLIVANMSNDDVLKEQVFLRVSNYLAEDECYDQAIVVANMIENNAPKAEALEIVCCNLVAHGQYDQAVQVAKMIPVEKIQNEALLYIKNDILDAPERNEDNMILLEHDRILVEISKQMQVISYIECAIDTACQVDRSELRDQALLDIATYFSKIRDWDSCLEIVNKIEDEQTKNGPLRNIARAFARKEEGTKCLKVIGKIQDESLRESAYELASKLFLDDSNFQLATHAAEMILDRRLRSDCLLKICIGLVDAGQRSKAKKLANEIPDEHIQKRAFKLINER